MKYIHLLSAILLCSCIPYASFAYDHQRIARLLEEQSYPELLSFASSVPDNEKDVYLLNAAGFAAYQSDMTDQAINWYKQSLSKEPDNVQALLYLGLINKQWNKLAEAIIYFKQLTLLKPAVARYRKYIADGYALLNKPDSAFIYLQEGYRISPTEPYITCAYADALLEKKQYRQADSVIRILLENKPGSPAALISAIKLKYLQKKYNEVLTLAAMLSEAGQISYVPFYYAMVAALQLKEHTTCLNTADLLISNGFETEVVLYYKAKALSSLKDYTAANVILRKCISSAISENAASYYTELAENMEQLKKYNVAQKHYDTALYLSGNATILYRKALAYDEVKQYPQAQKAYKSYLKNASRSDSAMIEYARSRVKQQ